MAPMAPGSSAGKLPVKAHYNKAVPLTLVKEEIMVEITGTSNEKGKTASLDLVVVLDTSASMQGPKLHEMQTAAQFIIQKFRHLDTLTFVPFSDKAEKPIPENSPLHMTDSVKYTTRDRIISLEAHGNANIKDGLLTAISILRHDRKDRTGRPAGIFLMSDGWQNVDDARDVDAHDFPIFTFGFGDQHDKNFLQDIADRSHGGTYHSIPQLAQQHSILDCFAEVLGTIRDFSVLNLVVTLKPQPWATIMQVEPGNYPVRNSQGSYTIDYGELARMEQRKILVVVQLPAVHNNERAKTILVVDFSYRLAKERETMQSLYIDMARDPIARQQAPSGHLKAEQARRDQARRIAKIKRLVDAKDLDKAMDELAEAKNALRIIEISAEHSNSMDDGLLDALSLELEHLEDMLESHEEYMF